MVKDGLDMYFFESNLELNAAVLLTTGTCLVVGDRYVRTITDSRHAACFNTFLSEVVLYRVCTLLRELAVHLCLAGVIRMSLYLDDVVSVLDEDIRNLIEEREGFLLDGRFAGLELDTLHRFLQELAYLTFEFRTTLVGLRSCYYRALVLVVGNPVAVAIEFATLIIDMSACSLRRMRAFVEVVRYAVAIGVFRTTLLIDGRVCFYRRSRALVEVVGYTVTVGIHRTTLGVNLTVRLFRRVRTLVEVVRNPVTIGV